MKLTFILVAIIFLMNCIIVEGMEYELYRAISKSNDVSQLEEISSISIFSGKEKVLGKITTDLKNLRTESYSRLGEIGTPQSLAAIKRIEKLFVNCELNQKFLSSNFAIHSAFHFVIHDPQIIAKVTGANGRVYGVLTSKRFGFDEFYLSTLSDQQKWCWPRLIPEDLSGNSGHRMLLNCSLEITNDEMIKLRFDEKIFSLSGSGEVVARIDSKEMTVKFSDIMMDSDHDGWTDLEELRLGLNPHIADTDGDGVSDGIDPCPNYAEIIEQRGDNETLVLKKAIFATFGLSGSSYKIEVSKESKKIQAYPCLSPIIYSDKTWDWYDNREKHDSIVFVKWSAWCGENVATVTINDLEGSLAAATQKVYLKKINGAWYVVKREFGPIS